MPEILSDGTEVPTWEELEEQRAVEEQRERASYAAVTDPALLAVLDVLAPSRHGYRMPIFEWGHETTPTAEEMIELSQQVVAALEDREG